MSLQAGDWPGRPSRPAAPAPPAARVVPAREPIAVGLAILMLLLFTQPWIMTHIAPSDTDSALARALYFPAYVCGVILLCQAPGRALIGLAREPFLIALLLVAAASVFWSAAPGQTERRVVALVMCTLCGVALGARWRWPRLVEIVAAVYALTAVTSLVLGLAAPSMGRMSELFPGAWRGLWLEKNALGGAMAFGALSFAAAALFQPRRSMFWWAMTALAIVLLGLSTSKTALVALMLGASALGFTLLVRRGGATAVAVTWLAVAAAMALAAAIAMRPDLFLALLGKDATLTGRTQIWDAVWRLIQQRPLLGYGYGAVWTDDTGWGPLRWIVKQTGFTPHHAHNAWLEQWLGLGVLGLAGWSLLYLSILAKTIWAAFTHKGALLVFPFLAVYSLMSLTESVALIYNDLRWVLFVAYAIRLSIPSEGEAE